MKVAIIFEKYKYIKRYVEKNNYFQIKNQFGTLGFTKQKKHDYLLSVCMGTSRVINQLSIINKLKYDVIIRIGTCGIIGDQLNIGEFGIVSKGVNIDAISSCYLKGSLPLPSDNLNQYLKKHLTLIPVSVFTIDLLDQEIDTEADVVDMESTALLCFGHNYKIKTASISLTRDSLKDKSIILDSDIIIEKIEYITQRVISIFEQNYFI